MLPIIDRNVRVFNYRSMRHPIGALAHGVLALLLFMAL